jgi:OmcA/MtrC family decaheme c-type cytochrome
MGSGSCDGTRPLVNGPFILLFIAAFLALAGCEGDDGDRGPQGEPGEPGEPGESAPLPLVSEAEVINAEITSVTVSSPPVVEFTLTDERGQGLVGLPASSIGFAFAKLIPGIDGNADDWQSYINEIEEAGSVGPGTADQIQSTRDRGSDEKLVDNGDGSYTYTYGIDVTNVTEPLAVPYEPFSRDIAVIDTCNNCHDRLEFHGGSRNQVEYCVTCHNPGSTDANSGNTVDFKQMIHKIHRGANLPSIVNGALGDNYTIWGFRDSEHVYSENIGPGETVGVIFPQDIRNCRNCHDESNPATPDAINWQARPTREACGSCHDEVNFDTGEGHAGGLSATNEDCQTCHGLDGIDGLKVANRHRILEYEAAERYAYNIIDATDTGPGQTPTVTFSVTDPKNNDTPYDIQNDPPFTKDGGASRLAIDIGWDTVDYTNTGSGSEVPGFRPGSAAQVVSLDPLFGGSTDNGDGTFSITSTVALPADLEGSLAVGIEGHPAANLDDDGVLDRIPVTGAVDYFGVTDGEPVDRRPVVAIDSCNACHEKLSLHGNNRTDNPQLCVLCHNPNATDIRARTEGGVDAMTAPDGKDEETIDFKQMIHAIHAGQTVLYGFGGGLHDYREVVFPGELANCENCHDGDTFYPVDQTAVLATTIDTGANLGDPTDDVNISPNASACFGCHRSAPAVSHMTLNGASFNATQNADGSLVDNDTMGVVVESCEVCHAEDRIADVEVVHGEHD